MDTIKKKKKAIQNNEIKVTSKLGNKLIFWELDELNKLKRNVYFLQKSSWR